MPTIRKPIFLITFLLLSASILAQKTLVYGYIVDGITWEPIPFANITFQGRTSGTISDFNGAFYLETANSSDTLIVSCMGYEVTKVKIYQFLKQNKRISLLPASMTLDEVVVTPGENPAFEVLRNIKSRKKHNNPDRFSSYQYTSYNKLRLDMNNVGKELKNRPVIRNFKFVFDNIDSSEVFGKNYLPVLMTESMARFYYENNPKTEREIIDAFKISGIQNSTISQFSGKMYQRLNIYDNFMTLFEPGFVSPIADFGRAYYDYHLEDSAMIDDSWCFKINFKPKRKLERTFYGYFWVADTSFAIKKIQLRVSPNVNINYLNDLIAINEYSRVNDSIWFLTREELLLDFYVTDNGTGFFGRKTSVYKDVVLNEPMPDSVANLKTDTYVDEETVMQDETYWEENRFTELDEKEQGIYDMVDSVIKIPTFDRVYSLIEMLTDYYYVMGPFEYGPYYTTYSNNPIEGHRFRVGGRTSNNFSSKYRIGGHVAYGTHDENIKYGSSLNYMSSTNPRRCISASYYHDIRQLGKSQNAFLDDNIMTTMLRRNPNYKLTMVDQTNMEYEHEWFQGFSNTLTLRHQVFYATPHIPFSSTNEADIVTEYSQISSAEISLNTHFGYREKFLLGKFERASLGSKFPIFDVDFTYGIKGILGSDYEYYKLRMQLSDKVETNPLGYLRYRLIGGQIFGTLPYPLLELHDGNETYAYDPYAFNMMNYYEFVSDKYAVLAAEHHLQGFFFNRIPFFRWLKLREVVTAKMLVGSLSDKNRDVMDFPNGLSGLSIPYSEAGVGFENLFNLIRIDAMWRLTYRDRKEIIDIQTFGLRATLQLTF